jgi:hypothetical protein
VKFIVTYSPFRLLPGAGTKSTFRLPHSTNNHAVGYTLASQFYRGTVAVCESVLIRVGEAGQSTRNCLINFETKLLSCCEFYNF